jgi:threonyl-tRNA synthetase
MRVRSLNMNDAYIYCTVEQFAEEFNAVNEMYLKYFKIFGLEVYSSTARESPALPSAHTTRRA